MSINLAIGQVFCANLASNTVITGLFQGAYGLGGTVAPLIATSMISRGYLWSRFYLTLLALAVFNLFLVAWAFWKYEAESDPTLPRSTANRTNRNNATSSSRRRWDSLRALLSHKTTVLGALFIFAYKVRLSLTGVLFTSGVVVLLEVLRPNSRMLKSLMRICTAFFEMANPEGILTSYIPGC
jgi:MFS family permease